MGLTGERVVERWPVFAGQLHDALVSGEEVTLAGQVGELRVDQVCGCGDDFCQSFYTAPPPEQAYPYDEGRARNVVLNEPGWDGCLILDMVDGQIAYVEVLDRPPLD
jgi:hypothetical protein